MRLFPCPDCSRELPSTAFAKNAVSATGLGFYCKECSNARGRASRLARRLARGEGPPRPHRRVTPARGHKWCPRCESELAVEAFGRNRTTHDGLTGYCRPCHAAAGAASRQRVHGGSRHYHLIRRYGIGAAEVEGMILAQGGLCAACKEKPAKHVDHDHATGLVRGILCFTCNVALGNVKDRRDLLALLVTYLERHDPELHKPQQTATPAPARVQPAPPDREPAARAWAPHARIVSRVQVAPGVWHLRYAA